MLQGAVGRFTFIATATAVAAAVCGAPAGAAGTFETSCPALGGGNYFNATGKEVAQTFTQDFTGKLTSAQISVTKNAPDPPGDWVMSIATVDGSGVPTHNLLASTVIPYASIAAGSINVPLVGKFASPAAITGGTTYALVIQRPGGSLRLQIRGAPPGCPGAMFDSSAGGPYSDLGIDLVFTASVDTPAHALIKKKPKRKTESDTAAIKFRSDEDGVTFRCKLDKGKFRKCTSPVKYRGLDPGKHRFRLEATDAGGNVATSNARWTVL